MQIWKVLEKCQNHSFFWDILNKMKDNLGQECVKGVLLPFQGKIGTIALISLENGSFASLNPTFPLVPT